MSVVFLDEPMGEDIPYDIEMNDQTVFAVTKRDNGWNIELNSDSQPFCDFLTWAWNRPKSEVGQYHSGLDEDEFKGIRFFSDHGRFVSHCKSSGVTLYVEEENLPEQKVVLFPNHMRFYKLFEAEPHHILGLRDGLVSKNKPFALICESLRSQIISELPNDESDIRKISNWPIDRTFVYLDVARFSEHPPGQQTLIIKSVTSLVHSRNIFQHLLNSFEAMLCIGDGYIFSFLDPLNATRFAARLATAIDASSAYEMLPIDFHFRIGVHTGPVYMFWEPWRNGWNYSGEGINGGNRVLQAIGKDLADVVFISDRVRRRIHKKRHSKDVEEVSEILYSLQNRGTKYDKHGNPWNVYELNHMKADPLPLIWPRNENITTG